MKIWVFELLFLLQIISLIAFGVAQKKIYYQSRRGTVVLKVPRGYAFLIGGAVLFVCIFSVLVHEATPEPFSEAISAFGMIAYIAYAVYLWLEWYSLSWRLEFSKVDDDFDYRNFFFQKKRFKYSDFSAYQIKAGVLIMKNGESRISIDVRTENYHAFVEMLKQKHIYQEYSYD